MQIEGWASTPTLDQALDVVSPGAFADSIATKGLNGPRGIKLLAQHDKNLPIGKITDLDQRSDGLYMKAEIDEGISYAADLANAIRANGGLSYSIGYRLDPDHIEFVENGTRGFWRIHKLDLHEISVVTFPCNADCVMVLPKSLEQLVGEFAQLTHGLARPFEQASKHADLSTTLTRLQTILKG